MSKITRIKNTNTHISKMYCEKDGTDLFNRKQNRWNVTAVI